MTDDIGRVSDSVEVRKRNPYGIPVSLLLSLSQVRHRLEQVSDSGALWSSEPQHLAEVLWTIERQLTQGEQRHG